MAGFRRESFKKESFVVSLINEGIYIMAVLMLVLNLVDTAKVEDRVILVIVELTFFITRIYCKVKNDQSNKNNYERKGDKKDEKKN